MIIREGFKKDISDIAKVHIDTWKATYKGILPEEFINSFTYEDIEAHIKDSYDQGNIFFFVAEDPESGIIGFAGGELKKDNNLEFKGELSALYIWRNYQGKGIGRRLFQAVVKKLLGLGTESMLVWVLEVNPNKDFYNMLGGKEVNRKISEMGTVKLEEIGYGWKNIGELVI